MPLQYLSNPNLPFIIANWKGNPYKQRFFDPKHPFGQDFRAFLKWQFSRNPQKKEKQESTWRLTTDHSKSFLQTSQNGLTWLGHASFHIRYNGVQILIDPVFYPISGVVRRHSELPCAVREFNDINYVLLSHFHRDHCDRRSLSDLSRNNALAFITSLGGSKVIRPWFPAADLTEMGWYQHLTLPGTDIEITHLPTRHWSNRYPWDTNQTLWGSYMIRLGEQFIFFGGDSGYSEYTKEIGRLFPRIDYALIGVGAYSPSYMMQNVHTRPEEAVAAAHDLGAAHFIPMHYGTYDLSDEPMHEPEVILRKMDAANQISSKLKILQPGAFLSIE
ncbi:MAG: MBL fold metallo-hydrolase [Chitinophagales bacterium]